MPGKAGGKKKPLKKKAAGAKHLSAEDIAFKKKKADEAKQLKALKASMGKKGFVKSKVGKKGKK